MTGGSQGRPVIVWVLAVAITLGAATYQRRVGPTRPVRGHATVGQREISYRLSRSHGGPADHEVSIAVPDDGWRGELVYRRYPTDDPWSRRPMALAGGHLSGTLPHQPPGGKVAYWLELRPGGETEEAAPATRIPPEGPVVIRFRGGVPAAVMIPHIIFMFAAMLIANRAGLEALLGRGAGARGALGRYTYGALGLMVLGGLLFGPAVQWYAFGEWWTGVPLGYDLTDNKTLIAIICWVIAGAACLRRSPRARGWVLAAALATLVIYSIPHSVAGTELDYATLPPGS